MLGACCGGGQHWQHERSPSSPSYETRIIVADATCMCILSPLLGGQAQRCFNNAFPPGSTKPGGSHERVTGSARARLLGPPYARRDGGTCDDWDRGRHGGPILTRQGATGGWNVYSLEQLLHGSGITTRCNMSSRQPHLRTRLRFVRLHVVLCWRCAAGQCPILPQQHPLCPTVALVRQASEALREDPRQKTLACTHSVRHCLRALYACSEAIRLILRDTPSPKETTSTVAICTAVNSCIQLHDLVSTALCSAARAKQSRARPDRPSEARLPAERSSSAQSDFGETARSVARRPGGTPECGPRRCPAAGRTMPAASRRFQA